MVDSQRRGYLGVEPRLVRPFLCIQKMQRQHRVRFTTLSIALTNLIGSLHLANEGMDRFGQGMDRIRYLNDRLLVGRRHGVDLFEDFFELALIHFDRPPNVYLEPAIGP